MYADSRRERRRAAGAAVKEVIMAVIEATDKNFDELIAADYAAVDFYAYHCGVCVVLAPEYNGLSNDLPLINFLKVNTDEYPELGNRFNIWGLPTVVFFHNGKEVFREAGIRTREALDKRMAQLLYGREQGNGEG